MEIYCEYITYERVKLIYPIKEGKVDAVLGVRMHSYSSALKGGMPIHKFIGNIGLTKFQNFNNSD